MKNLFNFIFKNIHWLLFFILVYLSVFLIVNNNQFQRSKYLKVAQEVTGTMHTVTNRFQAYLYLHRENVDLVKQISVLQEEVHGYLNEVHSLRDSTQTGSLAIDSSYVVTYRFLPARVVNNSVSKQENYMTLDKGSEDGIKPDMGVISTNGVVGVVTHTSPHFCIVISLLNSKYKPNGRIKRNNYFGPLVWDGKDPQYTYLTEIPRYVSFEPGDTIVTSGYSTVFPKGMPVGAIVDSHKQKDDNYTSIRIRLFTNFSNLNDVLIVTNRLQEEQKELEESVLHHSTHSQNLQ